MFAEWMVTFGSGDGASCAAVGAGIVPSVVALDDFGKTNVRTERTKFGREAMFGVGLQIEEGGGDRSASRKSEKNDEESAAVREKETANEAAKHRIVGAWRRHIHSPRRMGAGSQRVA